MIKKSGAATVLMSGGLDSAACAHHLLSQGLVVDGIFIDFGQASARPESNAVKTMAEHLNLTVRQVKVTGSHGSGPGELLGRNAFLIFTALFLTGGRAGLIGLGLHAGTPYYDCSGVFIADIGKLVAEHTDGRVSIVAPFMTWTKKDVYDYFVSAGLPVSATYSCETGTEPTCGTCASCRDREALGC